MRVHPRTRLVSQAEVELNDAMHEIWERHGLTTLEMLSVVQTIPPRLLKYALRKERHPDEPDKPADEA